MCGIAGVYSPQGDLPAPESMQFALQRLSRRGPDDQGTWRDAHTLFGHRRLAVLDLTPGGHQPMCSTDERFVIVFNGEIYNHQELRATLTPAGGWRGTSDTETLLEAYRTWGVECLHKLNGMFAFAIWDRRERTLFLARDRLGVKPLYYAWRDGRFAFASRPTALRYLCDGAFEADPQSVRTFLDLGYLPAPLSYYAQTHKLAAGHFIVVSERGVRLSRYWDFRHLSPDPELLRRSEDELAEELDDLVRKAVRLRLLSDVPLGAFLSGGVDSALVVAAMRATGVAHPRAFTIGFVEKAFDETPAAASIARHLEVDHIHETLSVDSLIELLPMYVEEFDEPFADSSAFPTLALARLARRHVTVALSGDAGDELHAGYHYYNLMQRLAGCIDWPDKVKRTLQSTLCRLPWHRAKLLSGALDARDPTTLFAYLRGITKDYAPMVAADVVQSTCSAGTWFEQTAASFAMDLTPAEIGMRLDTAHTLPDLFLNKVDVATMAFSLEARCPLTDYRLVEWSMRLPLHFKLREGQTKYLLKKVLRKYLPSAMVDRPKMGFGVPIAQWLRGPLREWARELIHDDTLMTSLPLERHRIRELLQMHLDGRRQAHPLLWSVLMLLCFERHQRTQQPVHRPQLRAA